MKRVSIMTNVSDEVYDNVVAPFKQRRKMSELIDSLLAGYLKDDYIAAYVDGTLDMIKQQSDNSIQEAFGKMKESFATMSMMQEQASGLVNEGLDAVNIDKVKAKANSQVVHDAVHEAEKEDLKREIDELKKQNKSFEQSMSKVLDMLQNIQNGKIVINAQGTGQQENRQVAGGGSAIGYVDGTGYSQETNYTGAASGYQQKADNRQVAGNSQFGSNMQVAQGNPESDRGQVYGTGYGAAEQQVASARVAGQGIARNAMGSMNGFSERQEQPKVVSMGGSFGRRSAQGNLTETPEPVRPVAQGSGELHLDEDDPLFADLNLGGDDEELRFNIYDEPEEEEDDDLDFLNSLMSGQVYGE